MLSGSSSNGSSRRFERLDDSFNGSKWTNNVIIERDDDDEDYELGERKRRSLPPENGIRVRTTVTVTEGVDWQDDLF